MSDHDERPDADAQSDTGYERAERHAAVAISHEQLRQAIRDCATVLGWLVLTTHNSRHSPAGEPDLRLILPDPERPRVIWAELKTGRGRLSKDQRRVIGALRVLEAAGLCEVAVWRERDWWDGTVEKVLRGEWEVM